MFKGFIEQGEVPNLLLAGPAGIGKTTIAKALCNELGADYYVINGSDEGRFLDTVRNRAKAFVSTVSLTSEAKHKVLIIDEADNTTQDVQIRGRLWRSFRALVGSSSPATTRTASSNRCTPSCSVVEFNVKGKEKQFLAAAFFKRVHQILATEGIDFELAVLREIVMKHFPDFRRTLNELQRYASKGKIDAGILGQVSDVGMNDLMGYLKGRKFTDVKKWVVSNMDNEPHTIMMRSVYDFSIHT